jgi:thioredoxin reductase/NAD-dependent dihydropyrimidine dehydrogenase PreA subunit
VNQDSIIVWAVAAVLVLAIVVPYVWRFRRRIAQDRQRKEEASRLGIDRPSAQFPYIDANHCIGCGACLKVCPEGDVLGIFGGTAVVINGLRCVGHAHCEKACPVGAIEVGLGDLKSRADVPQLDESLRSSVDGVFVVGELGGLSLVRNAVAQGRRAVEHLATTLDEQGGGTSDPVDVAIVGSGPAGLSAALTAKQRKLSYVVLEREGNLGGTLLHYPRQKMVLTRPVEIQPWGKLDREEYRKEMLLEIFQGIVDDYSLDIRFNQLVEDIVRDERSFTVRSPGGVVRARNVILAQGRRGLPRKLGVPGEELPKVMYKLVDASSYDHKKILVVGGGDSAIEAALGLMRQKGNRVTLSYRREKLVRIKKKNQDAADRALAGGKLEALFGSQVLEIGERQVELRLADGSTRKLDNDFVFIFAGGVPPFELLHKVGARFGGETLPG